MPVLTWPDKALRNTEPASLLTEAVIFPQGSGYPDTKPGSRLILGDNLPIMTALLPENEGFITRQDRYRLKIIRF